MPSKPLANYLKSLRRRAGLSQKELAFLIDSKGRDAVSKHERGKTTPPLEVLICYQLLYGTPINKLFAGRFNDLESLFRERVNGLLYTLEQKPDTPIGRLKMGTLKRFLGEEPIN